MSLFSRLQNIFSPPSTGDDDLDDESRQMEWSQNARIVLAIVIMFLAALVVFWILS